MVAEPVRLWPLSANPLAATPVPKSSSIYSAAAPPARHFLFGGIDCRLVTGRVATCDEAASVAASESLGDRMMRATGLAPQFQDRLGVGVDGDAGAEKVSTRAEAKAVGIAHLNDPPDHVPERVHDH